MNKKIIKDMDTPKIELGADYNRDDFEVAINGGPSGRISEVLIRKSIYDAIKRDETSPIVVNCGTEYGVDSLESVLHAINYDSTYGPLKQALFGQFSNRDLPIELFPKYNIIRFAGRKFKFLFTEDGFRDARNNTWNDWPSLKLVIDATGQNLDPTADSLLSQMGAGRRVLVTAPFKIRDKAKAMPDNAVTVVPGINDSDYNPRQHYLISPASCTTTCLAHMLKPLIDYYGAQEFLFAFMTTIHAATKSQAVLDALPKAGKADFRKARSILNNIILTTTGAANALKFVISENIVNDLGFLADSVRIPTNTGSLVSLGLVLRDSMSNNGNASINKSVINKIYQKAAKANKYLIYRTEQLVSSDIIGAPGSAIIDGLSTHTRSKIMTMDVPLRDASITGIPEELSKQLAKYNDAKVQLAQLVTLLNIKAWYDNEAGSYGNSAYALARNILDWEE